MANFEFDTSVGAATSTTTLANLISKTDFESILRNLTPTTSFKVPAGSGISVPDTYYDFTSSGPGSGTWTAYYDVASSSGYEGWSSAANAFADTGEITTSQTSTQVSVGSDFTALYAGDATNAWNIATGKEHFLLKSGSLEVVVKVDTSNNTITHVYSNDTGSAVDVTGVAAVPIITTTTTDGVVINSTGTTTLDFKVKGDTDDPLFLCDVDENLTSIGGAIEAGKKLKVHGATKITGNLEVGGTAFEISKLSDVGGTPDQSPTAMEVLWYNTSSSSWSPATISELDTVTIGEWNATVIGTLYGGTGLSTIGANGQILQSDGTSLSWVDNTPTLQALTDTDFTYSSGQVSTNKSNLRYNNTTQKWELDTTTAFLPESPSGTGLVAMSHNTAWKDFPLISTTIANGLELSLDTSGTSTNGNPLGLTINRTTLAGGIDIADLQNVSHTTLTTGDILKYNGTGWVNATGYATQSYVDTEITNLKGGANAAYDTLLELENEIKSNDTDLSAILTTQGTKADKTTTITAGDGISGGGDLSANTTVALDLNELTTATVNVANDSIAIVDADDSNASRKESIADLVSAITGTGLTATSGVIAADATDLSSLTDTSITAPGSGSILKYSGSAWEDTDVIRINSSSLVGVGGDPQTFPAATADNGTPSESGAKLSVHGHLWVGYTLAFHDYARIDRMSGMNDAASNYRDVFQGLATHSASLSGSIAASGVSIPFDIVVSDSSEFGSSGTLQINSEQFTFSANNTSTNTITISARAQGASGAGAHDSGDFVSNACSNFGLLVDGYQGGHTAVAVRANDENDGFSVVCSDLPHSSNTENNTFQQVLKAGPTGVILNEHGYSDYDFRVEGDTNANLLFCDASADTVEVGGDIDLKQKVKVSSIQTGSSNLSAGQIYKESDGAGGWNLKIV